MGKHEKGISIENNFMVALITVVKKSIQNGLILETVSCVKHTSLQITSLNYSLDQIYKFSTYYMPKITQRFLRRKEIAKNF